MGKYKDVLFFEVWKFLRDQKRQVFLSELVGAAGPVKHAWSECQQHHTEEGMKKTAGLKTVISERQDLFSLTHQDGHPLITLTEAARSLSSEAVLADKTSPAELASQASEYSKTNHVLPDPAELNNIDVITKRRKVASRSGAKSSTRMEYEVRASCESVWGKSGYQDIVWTPAIAAKKEAMGKQEKDMARALYEALCSHPGNKAPIALLGQDFKVSALKKDSHFANWKLQDVLSSFEDVFNVLEDGTVKPQPGAEAALPDVDEFLAGKYGEAELLLPDRIEEPRDIADKMQGLRIEIIRALHRRGGRANTQEFGVEFRVQQLKEGIPQASKIFDFMKLFPGNFKISLEGGDKVVELLGYDVDDKAMINEIVAPRRKVDNWGKRPFDSWTAGARQPKTVPFHASPFAGAALKGPAKAQLPQPVPKGPPAKAQLA